MWSVLRPLVFLGWAIAAGRFALEWIAPDASMYFGVYYVMPLVLLVFGLRGHFDGVGFWRLVLCMFLTAILVWGIPNSVSYTVAQFQGWTHGRFGPDRAPPIADTAGARILVGLSIGGLTALAGTVWMIGFSLFFAYLPARLRARRAA